VSSSAHLFCAVTDHAIKSADRVVFSIKGNKYRLILKIIYRYQIMWILLVGTHEEYNLIGATKI